MNPIFVFIFFPAVATYIVARETGYDQLTAGTFAICWPITWFIFAVVQVYRFFKNV